MKALGSLAFFRTNQIVFSAVCEKNACHVLTRPVKALIGSSDCSMSRAFDLMEPST